MYIYIHTQKDLGIYQFFFPLVSDSLRPMDCSMLGFPLHYQLLELAQTHVHLVMPSNRLILCHPLLLPSIFPSTRVFSNESVLHIRWPKYWNFSFSISPSNEYSGLISFRMDWLDLLAVQGTLKSLLQHHSSKASILCRSVFFMVQLSYPLAFFLLAKDFIVWIFANMTLYTSFNFLQNSTFHIAKSLHSPFYATFPSRGISQNHNLPDCVFVVVVQFGCAQLFVTPWTVVHQAPLSMGFPRQEYWSVLLSILYIIVCIC